MRQFRASRFVWLAVLVAGTWELLHIVSGVQQRSPHQTMRAGVLQTRLVARMLSRILLSSVYEISLATKRFQNNKAWYGNKFAVVFKTL